MSGNPGAGERADSYGSQRFLIVTTAARDPDRRAVPRLLRWNDFFEPLVYLASEAQLQPISVGLFGFLGLYSVQIGLLQAGAVIGMAIPVIIFMFTQRAFLKGIDLSGSTKG
jgi:hypothetical protein